MPDAHREGGSLAPMRIDQGAAVGQAVGQVPDETLEALLQARSVRTGKVIEGLVEHLVVVVPGNQSYVQVQLAAEPVPATAG